MRDEEEAGPQEPHNPAVTAVTQAVIQAVTVTREAQHDHLLPE